MYEVVPQRSRNLNDTDEAIILRVPALKGIIRRPLVDSLPYGVTVKISSAKHKPFVGNIVLKIRRFSRWHRSRAMTCYLKRLKLKLQSYQGLLSVLKDSKRAESNENFDRFREIVRRDTWETVTDIVEVVDMSYGIWPPIFCFFSPTFHSNSKKLNPHLLPKYISLSNCLIQGHYRWWKLGKE